MSRYYRLNLFSVICLNSVFQSMFPKSRMVFINISSILALQPLTTWGNYCGGKAARYTDLDPCRPFFQLYLEHSLKEP